MNIEDEKWYQGGDNINGQGILTAEREGNYVCLIPNEDDAGQQARAAAIERVPQLIKRLRKLSNAAKAFVEARYFDDDDGMEEIGGEVQHAINEADDLLSEIYGEDDITVDPATLRTP